MEGGGASAPQAGSFASVERRSQVGLPRPRVVETFLAGEKSWRVVFAATKAPAVASSSPVITTGAGWIVPRKYVEKVSDDGFRKAPVGAGPYKFVSFDPGVEKHERRGRFRLRSDIPRC